MANYIRSENVSSLLNYVHWVHSNYNNMFKDILCIILEYASIVYQYFLSVTMSST